MALVLADRVLETCTSPGTGAVTLLGATTGYQTFSSGIGNGNTCYYCIADQSGTNWEVGVGTYASSGNTLTRTTPISGSAATPVDFSSGTQNVFVTYPAEKSVNKDADGNVVIEAATNTGSALRITQTGTGNALLVEDSANPDSSPFVVDTAGKLISGSTSTISIQASSYRAEFLGSGSDYPLAAGYTGESSTGPRVAILKNRSADWSTNTIVQNNDTLGQLDYIGSDGTEYITAARIQASVDGTPGTNDMPGRLVFSTTADGASSPTERMRIDNAGRVGIGGTPFAGANVVIPKTVTGATNSYQLNSDYTIASDVTSSATSFFSYIQTQAAAFTLTNMNHFAASQRAIGAGSTVTNQYGFTASSTLTGATNNYGFHSNIASGTGRYNFYAAGTAANYFAGTVTANAVIESTTGGFKFPDGTTQTTAATAGLTQAKATGLNFIFGL